VPNGITGIPRAAQSLTMSETSAVACRINHYVRRLVLDPGQRMPVLLAHGEAGDGAIAEAVPKLGGDRCHRGVVGAEARCRLRRVHGGSIQAFSIEALT
jgi:hypothetical protein